MGPTLHDNAIGQLSERLDLPGAFMKELVRGEEWQRKLAVDMFGQYTEHVDPKNVLVRSVGGQARAVLSDRYRRMNNLPIFTSFINEAVSHGGRLYDGHLSDLRMYLEVIHPDIFQVDTPKNGMVHAAIGAQISSSDFGNGSLEVRLFHMQVRCLNGAVGQNLVREIHLGRRLSESDFAFSEETHASDTQTMALALRDVAGKVFQPAYREKLAHTIYAASEQQVDMEQEAKRLPKMGLHKDELVLVNECLMRSNPEDGVTGDLTMWKLTQAITSVAHGLQPERRREVQAIAGQLLPALN